MIGGWAHNRYAAPRFTGDFDFFVSDCKENQEKLRTVLVKFGYESVLPPRNNNLFRKKIIMLGEPPNRIDLITEIDGISFKEAWKNREKDLLDEIPVFFISLNDLITNKKATNRDKDKVDVKQLEKILGK